MSVCYGCGTTGTFFDEHKGQWYGCGCDEPKAKPSKLAVHFSSKTDQHSTPGDFFAKVNEEFGPFDLDPCADATNAKAPTYYTKEDDGLSKGWYARKVWVNPPYGRTIGKWVKQAVCEIQCSLSGHPDLVVMLLPARTDTKWWHDYVIPYASDVRFIRGRLRFGNAKHSAPFPSALVVFRRG